jgi:hypothetical protein
VYTSFDFAGRIFLGGSGAGVLLDLEVAVVVGAVAGGFWLLVAGLLEAGGLPEAEAGFFKGVLLVTEPLLLGGLDSVVLSFSPRVRGTVAHEDAWLPYGSALFRLAGLAV